MRIALVLLAACNQAWDLDETSPLNGSVDCPPIGETPSFRSGLVQVLSRPCNGYNFASKTAVASCHYPIPGNSLYKIETGTIDGPLALAGVPQGPGVDHSIVAISRDENRLYVMERGIDYAIGVYRRGSSWESVPALRLDLGMDSMATFGPIASDGERDHVIVSKSNWRVVTEYVVDEAWTEVRTQMATELGADEVHGLAMTSDGLRATFKGALRGDFKQFYTDRERIDMPFRPATILENVPWYDQAFMTDDCGRIYVAGVGSVFYARQ